MLPEITAEELGACIDQPDLLLLDVREADELEISVLSGVQHIPMGEVPDRLTEIDSSRDIVVICRTGGRSGRVTQYLLSQGFPRVRNLVGGMNGWAETMDPSLPVY